MPDAPALSVLIVSYNTADMTVGCLRSLYDGNPDVPFEVILVDNGSVDDTVDRVQRDFPAVRLLDEGCNHGFAKGVNVAAAQARAPYILLLNPDTIVAPGTLGTLLRFAADHPANGIYGGRTLRPDGKLEPASCWALPSLWSLVCFGTGLSTLFRQSRLFDPESLGRWPRDTVREVGMVSGCLMLMPRSLWEGLGGFDTRFFMYGEEADFCIRAGQQGWRPIITPDATIVHAIGASSSSKARIMTWVLQAKATIVRTYWPRPTREAGLVLLLAGCGLRAGIGKLTGRDGRAGWPAVWANRKQWFPGWPAGAATAPGGPPAPPARPEAQPAVLAGAEPQP